MKTLSARAKSEEISHVVGDEPEEESVRKRGNFCLNYIVLYM